MADGDSVRSTELSEMTVTTARCASLTSLPILILLVPLNFAVWPFLTSPSSGGTTSLERRACRICQSESGVMVRPCGCSGTMGDIHEACLSKWITESGRDKECEICKEPYSKGGVVFKQLRQWERPKIVLSDIVTVVTLAAMALSIFYIIWLIGDRRFIERVHTHHLPFRADDWGRIFLLIIFLLQHMALMLTFARTVSDYLKRQRIVQFVDRK